MSELQPPASPGPVAPANGTRLTLQGWITLCFALVLCASVSFMVEPGTLYLGLALLFALLVAAWSVPHRLRGIEAEWLVPPTIHAGTETTLGCRVRAKAGSAPLRVDAFDPAGGLFLPVSELPGLGRASTRLAWPARFPARGPLLLPPLLVRNEQPFGLVESRRQLGQRREVLVLPAIGVIQRAFHANLHRWLEQGPTSSAPGDEEISHLRAYRQGDPIHRIHWRASARLRTLLVAQRNAPACRHVALVLDSADPRPRSLRFERLVCVAATLVDHLAGSGWQVTLHGPAFPEAVTGERRDLLERLATVGTTQPTPLRPHLPPGALCLVLTARARLDLRSGGRVEVLTLRDALTFIKLPRLRR
ncbi:MAG: DUF58 domain-containing protein [Planctomycetota bacterium]